MQFTFPDPRMQSILNDLLEEIGDRSVAARLGEFIAGDGQSRAGVVQDAFQTVAMCLLLAKSVMPSNEDALDIEYGRALPPLRVHAVIVELALAMIAAERADRTDIFRDRNLIPDALFNQRLTRIGNQLVQ